jgi:hypothetical protein
VPRTWLADADWDTWLLHFTTDDPLTYAAKYTSDLDAWLDYYRDVSADGIATGGAVLHRPGAGRVVAAQAAGGPRGDATAHLLRIFDANADLARRGDDDALLGAQLALAGPHTLEQTADFRDGRYVVRATTLVLENSAGVYGFVDTDAVHVLPRLDGEAPLSAVVERTARETGIDRARLERDTLTTIRRLYELGFLERSAAD